MAKKKRSVKGGAEPTRPSLFFIIALVIGLILLVWTFIAVARRPPQPSTFGAASPPGFSIAA